MSFREEVGEVEPMTSLLGAKARRGRDGAQRSIRVYDFLSPNKFSKEQVRTLLMIHDNLSRALTTSLSAYLRSMVQMSVNSVEQTTYGQFVRGLGEPTILGLLSLPPLPSNALLEIDPELAFPMLDRLFGGPGQGRIARRALTDIEATVMRRVFQTFCESLREAWKNIVPLEPRLEALEESPLFVQLAGPREIVAAVSLSATVGGYEGTMKLCLPYLLLEPIADRLSTTHWYATHQERGGGEVAGAVGRRLAEVPVPVVAELGRAEVRVADLIALRAGDVIALERRHAEPLDVYVNGVRKFLAAPGSVGNRLGVVIERVLEQGVGPDD